MHFGAAPRSGGEGGEGWEGRLSGHRLLGVMHTDFCKKLEQE